MPRTIPPVVPAGRMRGHEQPVLTAGGGLVLRRWHDMHLHARIAGPPGGA